MVHSLHAGLFSLSSFEPPFLLFPCGCHSCDRTCGPYMISGNHTCILYYALPTRFAFVNTISCPLSLTWITIANLLYVIWSQDDDFIHQWWYNEQMVVCFIIQQGYILHSSTIDIILVGIKHKEIVCSCYCHRVFLWMPWCMKNLFAKVHIVWSKVVVSTGCHVSVACRTTESCSICLQWYIGFAFLVINVECVAVWTCQDRAMMKSMYQSIYHHHDQHLDDLLSITTKDTFKFVKDAVVFIQVAQPAA